MTLAAYGSIIIGLNVSMPLRKEQFLVLRPTGKELPATDLRFRPIGRSQARIDFVVTGSGFYRVLFRDRRGNAVGKQHSVEAERE